MKTHPILLFLLQITIGFTWKFKQNPYADLSFEEKVAHDGYPLETYQIETKDNYLLALYRIPRGRLDPLERPPKRRRKQNRAKRRREPVLILHGLGSAPAMYVLQGPGRALAYNLVDSGFDVWLLSNRGCGRSDRHRFLDIDVDRKFWDFSFHEIAIYDLPPAVDFVANKTDRKLTLLGHSQGNTIMVIFLAEKPEYNDKVKLGVIYAPSVKIYLDMVLATPVIYASELLTNISYLFGMYEVFPQSFVAPLRDLCKEQTYFLELCYHILSAIGSAPSKLLDLDLIPTIIGAASGRASLLQLTHYMQIIRTNYFGQFDHGPKKNMKIYGNSTPPAYDLNKISAPMAVYYAPKDELATIQGALDTIKLLPNVIHQELVDYEYFNHIDFLFAKNATELVYVNTINLIKSFDEKFANNSIN
ncbi:unnamed protein product [Phyllotreta striolata]|uniref:Lipase n=1 Tax=Phyllotreta striolata TaxID=444603 RepID=A0A9N9XSI8_PHYSR|nr:unnamed protein product [Phyllotreta striolata]